MRGRYYELLTHCIPPDIIFKVRIGERERRREKERERERENSIQSLSMDFEFFNHCCMC